MIGRFKEFEKKDLYFKKAVSLKVLEKLMRYRVKCEKTGNRNYVDGTVKNLARLHARTGCVVTTTDTETERDGQRQSLFTTLYGK